MCVKPSVCVCVSPPPLHPYCHSPKASLLNWLTDNKIIQESTATETFVPQSNSLTSAITAGLHLKHCEDALKSASERFDIQKRPAFNKYLDHEIKLNFLEAASTLVIDHKLNNEHLFMVWHWSRARLWFDFWSSVIKKVLSFLKMRTAIREFCSKIQKICLFHLWQFSFPHYLTIS